MEPWRGPISSSGSGSGGLRDSSNGFSEFFFKSEAEKPTWMAVTATESGGKACDARNEEENLLDDAHSQYMSRQFSIDSASNYSRTCSLESQDSNYYNDHETEVVLRVAMCCGKCENKAKSLTQLEGVTSVVCERKTEKVVVTGTARPRDVLEACRKLFEQAKLWTPDDNLCDPNNIAGPQ